jgi:GDP-4-dehydro-6-deoxy-D-mannose reductase
MRALVVGAGGFVGLHLLSHLQECGHEVVAATQEGVCPGFGGECLKLDITDSFGCAAVLQKARADFVYHLAGISFVPQAEADFEQTLKVNVAGTSHLIRQAHLLGSNIGFLFTSSAEVYGQITPSDLPITENTPPRPANNYSLSKRMAELVVERYIRVDGTRCVVVRPFNHIGPGQDPRFVVSNFALQLARIARGEASPVLQVGNLEARRDFSDVRDIVRAYAEFAVRGSGVYNLGSGVARSIQSILDELIDISGLAVEVRKDPARMRGPEVLELRCSYAKAESEIGWTPRIPFRSSLESVYRYWYDQLNLPKAV